MFRHHCASTLAALAATLVGGVVYGQALKITIEDLQPADGFFLTPVWLGFNDGGFDLYDPGTAATPGLEDLAEDGITGTLSGEFNAAINGDGTSRFDTVVTAPGGFGGAPVLDPGEVVTVVVNVPDPGSNRYLTYASMVIPSNDAFIGNGNPLANLVFNPDGSFAGPLVVDFFGSSIHDSGTEVNDTMGAAFSAVGGTATDEGGTVIALHAGLDNFVGTDTVAGTTIGSAIGGNEALARITVELVPEPTTGVLMSLASLAYLSCRKRRSRR